METYFIVAYFIGFIGWGIIRAYYQKQYGITHKQKIVEKRPKREAFLVRFVGLSVALPTLVWAFTPFLAFATLPLPTAVRWLGLPISLFSTWYFYEVHRQLGKNWSPVLEIRPKHELVVTGLYQFVRHPMYSAMWVWWLGNVFLTANWVLVLVQFIGISGMLAIRLPDEERMMVEQFGEQYKAYCKKTKRFIPFIF